MLSFLKTKLVRSAVSILLCFTMVFSVIPITASAEAYRKQQPYYPYYGAGYIQLTWDYNYKAFSNYVNDPLVYSEGPQYVARKYAWSAAGWFWTTNNINTIILNGGTVESVTRKINGGYNHLSQRQTMFKLALGALGG